MQRTLLAALAVSVAACSETGNDLESVAASSAALNGSISNNGFLVRDTLGSTSDENLRRKDTFDRDNPTNASYYRSVGTGAMGGTADPISTTLDTLQKFKNRYFTGTDTVTRYYNRGDLGLGREMHCVDRTTTQEVACYVTNYAAGSDGSEFTFGFSKDIAFSNMDAGNDVATVAMVFRNQASTNKIFFVVYDANEQLADNAPLDRHGINFANGFAANGNSNPDANVFGTPGTNLNNHIPTNCLNCHGGLYNSSNRQVTGAVFLPFDLDQFEYREASGQTRAAQLTSFRTQNQFARKVAVAILGAASPVVKQIDGWYGNTAGSATLTGSFDPDYVPPGWVSGPNRDAAQLARDTDIYRSVVRPSCRGCHLVSSLPFEGAAEFPASSAAAQLASNAMPHALQTQRLFWQSSQPVLLEKYWLASGDAAAASTLHTAGPRTIVTLDPHLVTATLF